MLIHSSLYMKLIERLAKKANIDNIGWPWQTLWKKSDKRILR